ncbi:M20/M25/M40 family metallo-hydrolase [Bradyrhizobium sp. CCGUVB23]|uniref:M20/M25/M40 family metallo-hydrolase n=1 Tax=Bradyrhizobium sp. CCGUVB23 TaxID=2949630 RepID=UPI0020B19E34|nr:M20/M25/M40 family metallo-hydrolase [Bradyrhizobium sp. CCGUVB23]MCP3463188.1 M20/M25/M40 family metallo-hydrolase [Bradyrhizobium sp. CCGUVB23]
MDGPIVVTVGQLQGGNRFNILPETAEIAGTIRSLLIGNRKIAQESVRLKAQRIAESYGVTAEVTIESSSGYEVLVSDPAATKAVIPALEAATGPGKTSEIRPTMGSEDFGSFGRNIPVVFWILNASPFSDRAGAPYHAPEFAIDETALRVGVRALVGSAMAYMLRPASAPTSERLQR